jgi:hypothetical protein
MSLLARYLKGKHINNKYVKNVEWTGEKLILVVRMSREDLWDDMVSISNNFLTYKIESKPLFPYVRKTLLSYFHTSLREDEYVVEKEYIEDQIKHQTDTHMMFRHTQLTNALYGIQRYYRPRGCLGRPNHPQRRYQNR